MKLVFLLFTFSALLSAGQFDSYWCKYWIIRLDNIAMWEEELIRAREENDHETAKYFLKKIREVMKDLEEGK